MPVSRDESGGITSGLSVTRPLNSGLLIGTWSSSLGRSRTPPRSLADRNVEVGVSRKNEKALVPCERGVGQPQPSHLSCYLPAVRSCAPRPRCAALQP